MILSEAGDGPVTSSKEARTSRTARLGPSDCVSRSVCSCLAEFLRGLLIRRSLVRAQVEVPEISSA